MRKQVALVTGAAGGIGFEMAREFAREGASVIVSDLRPEACEKAASKLAEEGFDAAAIPYDVTKEAQVADTVNVIQKQYGRLDILVNNAGIQHVAPIEEFPTETFEQLIKVMLTAPFIAMKHVFPIMKKQQFGRIINIASVNGLVGFAGKSAYNSAKHGVIGLTKVGALEARPTALQSMRSARVMSIPSLYAISLAIYRKREMSLTTLYLNKSFFRLCRKSDCFPSRKLRIMPCFW